MIDENKMPLRAAIIPTLCTFIIDFGFYSPTMKYCAGFHHYCMATAFDRWVPVIAWFAPIYLSFFIFWFVSFLLAAKAGKDQFYRLFEAYLLAEIVLLLCFIFLPTTNAGMRPEINSDAIQWKMLSFVYGSDQPTNLFPSGHVLISWFAFVGVRGRKEIAKGYRIFACVWAILIIIATQVLKQHVIADAIASLFIVEFFWWLCGNKWHGFGVKINHFFTAVNRLLHIEAR